MNTYKLAVAAELRAEMARKSVTQSELGTRIGKPQTTISRWCREGTADLDDISLVAKGLGVSVVDLVSRAWEVMAESRCTLPSELGSVSSQVRGLEMASA